VQFAPETQVGPWVLISPLGQGGNAEVWRARRDGEPERAVKILLDRRPAAIPYQRFRREIETLRNIGERPDVVPMLDWNLPESPSRTDRAWMAMPIAIPIRDALTGQSLETVVEAIAGSLVDLAEQHGLAHRDIKPGNLYTHTDSWAVGDFGLVDLPGADTLTEEDRVIGPANFVAYEMMVEANTADSHLADVYSLAKTLWVLATEQTWPPPGHQPQSNPQQSVGAFRAHPRADALDRLIDRSTLDPAQRPSLRAFADELQAWLATPVMSNPENFDLTDLAARLRASYAPALSEEQAHQDREAAAASTAALEWMRFRGQLWALVARSPLLS
jgi:serine/threonine protein kinase